jgi:hypothetical protein
VEPSAAAAAGGAGAGAATAAASPLAWYEAGCHNRSLLSSTRLGGAS